MMMIAGRWLLMMVVAAGLMSTGCAGAKIRQLRTEKQMLEAEVMQLRQDSSATQEALLAARKRAEGLESGAQENRARAAQLQRELERVEGELSATKLALTGTMDSRAKEFTERISQGLQREQDLKAQIDALEGQVASAELEQVKAEENASETQRQLTALRTQLQEATEARSNAEAELARVREALVALETEKADLSSRLRQAEDLASAAQTQQAEQQAQMAKLTQELETQRGELEKAAQASARHVAPEELEAAAAKARQALAAQISAGAAQVEANAEDGEVRLLLFSDGLFDRGTVILSDGGRATLSGVENFLGTVDYDRLRVAGHTDNVPVANMPYTDNWELAAARAAEVVRWLDNREGVDEETIVAESHSYFRPIASNDSASGRAKNRRVEVVVHLAP